MNLLDSKSICDTRMKANPAGRGQLSREGLLGQRMRELVPADGGRELL